MQWRADRCWCADRYRIRERGELYVAEYELAAWFDQTLMRARQLHELGAHKSLEKAQAACARHARRCKKREAA